MISRGKRRYVLELVMSMAWNAIQADKQKMVIERQARSVRHMILERAT